MRRQAERAKSAAEKAPQRLAACMERLEQAEEDLKSLEKQIATKGDEQKEPVVLQPNSSFEDAMIGLLKAMEAHRMPDMPESVRQAMHVAHTALGTDEEALHERRAQHPEVRIDEPSSSAAADAEEDSEKEMSEADEDAAMDRLDEIDDNDTEGLVAIAKDLKRLRRDSLLRQ